MITRDIKVVPKERVQARHGMTPMELRIWRAQRPGRFKWKRSETRPGWTQKQAAEWAGVSEETWSSYEQGRRTMSAIFIKRLQDYQSSYPEVVDRMFQTAADDVEENQGVHPELKDEPKPDFRGGY